MELGSYSSHSNDRARRYRRGTSRVRILAGVVALSIACTLVAAAPSSALPAKFYGLQFATYDESASDIQNVAWAGAKYFRYSITWYEVLNNGWEDTENVFTYAKENGITILPTLYGARTTTYGGGWMPFESEYGEWAEFVDEAVGKFGREGTFWNEEPNSLAPIAWEVWNEPNYGVNGIEGKTSNAEKYTTFLKTTHDAIIGVDPGATVLMGGLYWNAVSGWNEGYFNTSGHDFLDAVRIYETLLYGESGQYFDGLSLHPYSFYDAKNEKEEIVKTKVERVGQWIEEARSTLNVFPGGSSKGIWITELGWPTGDDTWNKAPWAVSEAEQESMLDESFDLIEGMQSAYGIESLLWYNHKDGTAPQWDQHSGLRTHGGAYKKAWGAFMEHADGGYRTETGVTPSTLNGQPGWVTLSGSVNALEGGPPINEAYVNIRLQKNEGSWVTKAEFHPTLVNGGYTISNYGAGKGEWRVITYFPAQGPFRKSQTGWHKFKIKDGYQLQAKHSGRCADVHAVSMANGATLQQWDCLTPATSQNQVFKLVPMGEGYFQLVVRHSGRCVDVTNVSTANGAGIQQWTCLGAGQTNQLWKPVAVSGEYVNFVAKHSGKCLDVSGAGAGNGYALQQWACLGAGQANQLWKFLSVEAADIPTSTSINLTSVVNGTPGSVSLNGHVETGAYPVSGQYVNVNYQKYEGGGWVYKFSNHPTLDGSGNYSKSGQGAGVGSWRVRTVYPGDSGQHLASSNSAYAYFTIKK